MLLSGAVNSQQLIGLVIAGGLSIAIFLVRLYGACKGQIILAPYPDSDIQRLQSCHFIFVNKTLDDMSWFVEDLEQVFEGDKLGFLSCELYFSQENETAVQYHQTHPDSPMKLRSRRPKWTAIFGNLSATRYAGSKSPVVGLFFCGGVAMGNAIRASAKEISLGATDARYIFKMENF